MKMRCSWCGLVSMALVMGALVLASCSTTPQSPVTSDTSATTKPYGDLTAQTKLSMNIGGSLDPHEAGGGTFAGMASTIFENLLQLTPAGQPGPGLAERWEIAPDGMSHTFYIRKGVKFHDGSDLTAADVKFSIERVLDLGNISADGSVWRPLVDRLEVKDDYSLTIHPKSPQFELLRGFGNMSPSTAVVPKKYIEEKGVSYFEKNPVGTGPWKFVRHEPGNRLSVEAVDSHWREVPKFKNLKILNVTEETTIGAMLKTGELDIAVVAPDSVPGLKTAGMRISSYYGGEQYVLYLFFDVQNLAQYPLGDVRVRRALSQAIDRKEMSDKLMGGYAEPSAFWRIPASVDYFDPNVLKPDPYDPDGAKKLLAEAGYPNGFNMRLWSRGAGNTSVKDLAVVGYWRKIGVNVEVIAREGSAIRSMYHPKHTTEIFNSAVGTDSAAGAGYDFGMMNVYHSKLSVIHNTNSPKLDALIDKAPLTADPVERKKLQLEALVTAKNEYTFLPVLNYHTIVAIGPKVGGLTTIPGKEVGGYELVTATHAK